MGLLSGLADELLGGFFAVRVVKTLQIRNARLGLFLRLLQLSTLLYLYLIPSTSAPWNRVYQPQLHTFAMWFTEGGPTEASDSRFCTDPQAYSYNWSSEFAYKPAGCKSMSLLERTRKMNSKEYFVTTFAQDTNSWSGVDATCNQKAEEKCMSEGGRYTVSGDECFCDRSEEYFSQNPAGTIVNLVHGYQVAYQDPFGAPVQVGERAPRTVFYSAAGSQCSFGEGKESWSREDQASSISVSLHELLSCAGLDLDAESDTTRSKLEGEAGTPTARLTGAQLRLEFMYENQNVHEESVDGILCKVVVHANPQWTSKQEVQTIEDPSPISTARHSITHYLYGIEIEATGSGRMAFFELASLTNAVAYAFVVLQIPGLLVTFISLHLIGVLSQVYKAAAREILSMQEKATAACARLASFEAGFRLLSGQIECKNGLGEKISTDRMYYILQYLFQAEGHNHGLNEAELHNMAQFVVNKMDSDSNGLVSMHDFVSACNQDEPMRLGLVGSFFNAHRKLSIMEQVFNERHVFHRHKELYHDRTLFDIEAKIWGASDNAIPDLQEGESTEEAASDRGILETTEAETDNRERDDRKESLRDGASKSSGEPENEADPDVSLLPQQLQLSHLRAELEKLIHECRAQLERPAEQLSHLHGREVGREHSYFFETAISSVVTRLTEDLGELKAKFGALSKKVDQLAPLQQAEQALPSGAQPFPYLPLQGFQPPQYLQPYFQSFDASSREAVQARSTRQVIRDLRVAQAGAHLSSYSPRQGFQPPPHLQSVVQSSHASPDEAVQARSPRQVIRDLRVAQAGAHLSSYSPRQGFQPPPHLQPDLQSSHASPDEAVQARSPRQVIRDLRVAQAGAQHASL
eukprot:TRINITY_DN30426_c0_g1_i3.p1 TRINITY_DN30426_c0_g1~~TRINITY_DN30426_c0_g1_i3.p1  ORF type:complete len:878 (+),score=93.75 TRINITY_DN30426_c0_g1_i3:48-2636(+)